MKKLILFTAVGILFAACKPTVNDASEQTFFEKLDSSTQLKDSVHCDTAVILKTIKK